MTMNWLPIIKELQRINDTVSALVGVSEFSCSNPNAPASSESLAKLESLKGIRLDQQHRSFLLAADGWSRFSGGTISLLSADDMIESDALTFGLRNIGVISRAAMGAYKNKRKQLLVVGSSDCTLDVVCMLIDGNSVRQEVIWFNNTEPEVFSTFEIYLRSFVEYGPQKIQYYANRRVGR